MPDLPGLDAPGRLLAVRASAGERSWGGAHAIRNIGIGERSLTVHTGKLGAGPALSLYRNFIIDLSLLVHQMEPADFDALDPEVGKGDIGDPDRLRQLVDAMLAHYMDEAGEPFPQDPRDQFEQIARAMARSWNSPTARILRRAKGAPPMQGSD